MAKFDNKQFDPGNLPQFTFPKSFLRQFSEFCNDAYVLAYKDERGNFKIMQNFTNNNDFLAFMMQMQIYCGAQLGCSAQQMTENIIDDFSEED